MSLQLTGSSSRVTKSSSKASTKRKSPFAPLRRNRALLQPFISPAKQQEQQGLREPSSEAVDDTEVSSESLSSPPSCPLPDLGCSQYLSTCHHVLEAIHRTRRDMFAELPSQRSGMNSTRTADLLNYRRGLPPIVPLSHIHTLLEDSTSVEREIAKLTADGKLRRVFVSRRGKNAALGDCLILMDDWEELIQKSTLDLGLRDKFFRLLRSNPKPQAISTEPFSQDEVRQLVNAGFFVSNTSSITSTETGQMGHASGTASRDFREKLMALSVPNLGAYLHLLTIARVHLLHLLAKSPYNEAPLSLLKERWDGNVADETSYAAQARHARGEWFGVLPGRTKKWRDLKGLNFRWVLEQAVGDGVVEIFETGSIGPGVRRV